MSNVSVQTFDIWTAQRSWYHDLEILRSTVRVVITPIQHIIFKDKRIPLSKQNASLFRVISQTVMGRFHSIRESFNDGLNIFISGLGVTYAF